MSDGAPYPGHGSAKDETCETATSATSTTFPQQRAVERQKQQLQQDTEHLKMNRVAIEQPLQQLHLDMPVSPAASAVSGGSEQVDSRAAALPGDIVTLNVGGKLFSCQRQTLCLVKESLLELMFSGRWPGPSARDQDGNVFLDLDPSLFETVLNWLRRFNLSHGGNIPEPVVPDDKVAHMLVMLDYLQLHRHIPIAYPENFDHQHHSPFMMVHGATVTRTAIAAQHKGKHTNPVKSTLMQFAVTDTAHSYFDMHVDITLEVLNFQDSVEHTDKPQYMFIGFVHKAAAAKLAADGDINTQLTKSPSCYGWLVGGRASYFVRHGKRSQDSCTGDILLWNQGDQVVLTLDTRRDKDCAIISILNTVTGAHKSVEAEPIICQSGSRGSPGSSRSRPGIRFRTPRALRNTPGGVHRQEILAVLNGQPSEVNGHVAELVVGAAMQVLEAQGIGMQAALDVLRQPGLVQRLVQQVRHLQQTVRRQTEAARRPQQQDDEPAATAAADAAAAGPAPSANRAVGSNAAVGASGDCDSQPTTADSAASQPNRSAAAEGRQQLDSDTWAEELSNGCIPGSSAEYEWVLVVGMVQPKDTLRLVSVRRRGQSPSLE